MHWQIYNVVKF